MTTLNTVSLLPHSSKNISGNTHESYTISKQLHKVLEILHLLVLPQDPDGLKLAREDQSSEHRLDDVGAVETVHAIEAGNRVLGVTKSGLASDFFDFAKAGK